MNKTATAFLAVFGLACASGADCVHAPCALPLALTISVTAAASGAAVTSAVVSVTGSTTTTVACNGTCNIIGTAGRYDLDISAPGFATFHRSIEVQGTDPACGCSTAFTQRVAITLNAAS